MAKNSKFGPMEQFLVHFGPFWRGQILVDLAGVQTPLRCGALDPRGLKAPPPLPPPACARATPNVNVDSWKKVRHLPPFGGPDWVNKAL